MREGRTGDEAGRDGLSDWRLTRERTVRWKKNEGLEIMWEEESLCREAKGNRKKKWETNKKVRPGEREKRIVGRQGKTRGRNRGEESVLPERKIEEGKGIMLD